MNSTYKQKYLKYKNKYIKIKNQYGGNNYYVQCGDSNSFVLIYTEDRSVYIKGNLDNVSYENFTKINKDPIDVKFMVGGKDYALIYTENGDLYGIGSNDCGQLGKLKETKITELTLLKNDTNIKSIYCYFKSTLILKTNDELYIMGNNVFGTFFEENNDLKVEGIGVINKNTNSKIYDETHILTCKNIKQIVIYCIGHMHKSYYPIIVKYDGTSIIMSNKPSMKLENKIKAITSILESIFVLYLDGRIVEYKKLEYTTEHMVKFGEYKNTNITQLYAVYNGNFSNEMEWDLIGLTNDGKICMVKDILDEGNEEFNNDKHCAKIVINKTKIMNDKNIEAVLSLDNKEYFCLKSDGMLLSTSEVSDTIIQNNINKVSKIINLLPIQIPTNK